MSEDAIRARDADIIGREPRMLPLPDDQVTQEMRDVAAQLRAAAGLAPDDYIPEYMRTVLRHTTLYRLHSDFAAELMAKGDLSGRDRELIVLRVGWLCRAPYEWNSHVQIARRIGVLSDAEIAAVTVGSSDPIWADHERAVLRAVEELLDDAMITDATWDALSAGLSERQLLELPILIGQYQGVAYLQNSFRMRLMPGQVGLTAR